MLYFCSYRHKRKIGSLEEKRRSPELIAVFRFDNRLRTTGTIVAAFGMTGIVAWLFGGFKFGLKVLRDGFAKRYS